MAGNDFYLLFSYIAGAAVLLGLLVISLRAKKKDEAILHKLEAQLRQLTDKQVSK